MLCDLRKAIPAMCQEKLFMKSVIMHLVSMSVLTLDNTFTVMYLFKFKLLYCHQLQHVVTYSDIEHTTGQQEKTYNTIQYSDFMYLDGC